MSPHVLQSLQRSDMHLRQYLFNSNSLLHTAGPQGPFCFQVAEKRTGRSRWGGFRNSGPSSPSPVKMTTVSGTRVNFYTSRGFWVDFLVEKVLCQKVQFSILLADCVGTGELELLERKFIKFVLHLPDG